MGRTVSKWNLRLLIGSLLTLTALPLPANDDPLDTSREASWQERLETVRTLAEQGRYFSARDHLQPLQADYPQLGVLDLEAAVIAMALDDYHSAQQSINRVLNRDDLPEAVRINALLLAETIEQRTANHETPQWRAEGGVQTGREAWTGQPWAGSSLWLQREQALATLDLAGYPTRLRSRFALSLEARRYFQVGEPDYRPEPLSYRLEGRGGLTARWRAWTLETALGYRTREFTHGALFNSGAILALTDRLDLFTQHQSHYRSELTSVDHLWRLGARLRPVPRWQIEAEYLRGYGANYGEPYQAWRTRMSWSLPGEPAWQPQSLSFGATLPLADPVASGRGDFQARWAAEGWRPGWDGRLQVPLDGATPGGEIGLYWQY